ncbi:hypothetical protein ACF3MZ_29210 [Paenibacillaceae bacterium WGS1546]|uniref:hypothetical protein n=1 Tax=Cohnella sp. WGS1546 TaxID=3366810 RepID=UPI00372CED8F
MASKKTAVREAAAYDRDELVRNAEALFRAKPEAVAGALHDAGQTNFTVDEARRLVGQFLKRKVL